MTDSDEVPCKSQVLIWSRVRTGMTGRRIYAECCADRGSGDCGYVELLDEVELDLGDPDSPDWYVKSDMVLRCMINHYEHARNQEPAR